MSRRPWWSLVRLVGRLPFAPDLGDLGARLRRATVRRWPPVRLGSLRRLAPISGEFGFDRGMPIDRYYIDSWLSRFATQPNYLSGAISGRVLEVGGSEYVRRFGVLGERPALGKVHRIDVLHVDATHEEATITGDLTDAATLPKDAFDCLLCIQTLHLIWDVEAAVRNLHRAMRTGGTVLVTVPGITRGMSAEREIWGDWWRFTVPSARRLFADVFGPENVCAEAYGNVLTAVGFLHGLAAEDLKAGELNARDPNFEVLVAVKAVKGAISNGDA